MTLQLEWLNYAPYGFSAVVNLLSKSIWGVPVFLDGHSWWTDCRGEQPGDKMARTGQPKENGKSNAASPACRVGGDRMESGVYRTSGPGLMDLPGP